MVIQRAKNALTPEYSCFPCAHLSCPLAVSGPVVPMMNPLCWSFCSQAETPSEAQLPNKYCSCSAVHTHSIAIQLSSCMLSPSHQVTAGVISDRKMLTQKDFLLPQSDPNRWHSWQKVLKPNDELSPFDVVLTTHTNIYMDTSESKEMAVVCRDCSPWILATEKCRDPPSMYQKASLFPCFYSQWRNNRNEDSWQQITVQLFFHHKFIQADVTDRKKQKHIHVLMWRQPVWE